MSKIGIVTIFGFHNFGNRLQNYAVERILTNRGYQCETLVPQKSYVYKAIKAIYHSLKRLQGCPDYIRYRTFEEFVKRTTNVRYIHSKTGLIPEYISKEYDYFVTGSDQVWNPEFRKAEKDDYFLRFAAKDQRICISPSFGMTTIPDEYRDMYKRSLDGFIYLCAREEEGTRIINELTGRTAETLVDPSMMLGREDWRKVYDRDVVPDEPYLFQYFLEPLSKERSRRIEALANRLNVRIIDIADRKSSLYSTMAPDGFLQMIENAALVCTDSFHTAAFSINFNTPFYVFKRVSNEKAYANNMISRIDNLLKTFALEDRFEPNATRAPIACDFTEANQRLEEERRRASDYLVKCLKQKEQ